MLWLHGREDASVVEPLLAHALAALRGAPQLHAFQFASALGLGLEGLPVRHRPVTDKALRQAGFAASDLWRYMRRELPAPSGLPARSVADVGPSDDRSGWRLEVRSASGEDAADAEVSEPVDGIGVLWWIGVDPAHRGAGLGRALLDQALRLLAERGAREVILFVDDERGGERDRTAANRLYETAGFEEVDRLWSYTRPAS